MLRKLIVLIVTMALGVLGVLVPATSSQAAASPWVYDGFSTGGTINEEVLTMAPITIGGAQKYVIGGKFTSLGGSDYLAILNADGSVYGGFTAGTSLSTWADTVEVVTVGGAQKILVGGAFSSASGNRMLMFNPDGSIDTSFDIGTYLTTSNLYTGQERVWDIEAVELGGAQRFIVGGKFMAGTNHQITIVNEDGTPYSGFSSGNGIPNYQETQRTDRLSLSVVTVAGVQRILVGGQFLNAGPGSNNNVALMFNMDGTIYTGFTPRSRISEVVISPGTGATLPTNTVLSVRAVELGGAQRFLFGTMTVEDRPFLYALNEDGTLYEDFVTPRAAVNGSVYSIESVTMGGSTKVVIGGFIYAAPNRGIALLNADGSVSDLFSPGVALGVAQVNAIVPMLVDSRLKFFIGGYFTNAGAANNDFAAAMNTTVSPNPPGQPTVTLSGSGAVTVGLVPPATTPVAAAKYVVSAVQDPTKTCEVLAGSSPLSCEVTGLSTSTTYTFTAVTVGVNDETSANSAASASIRASAPVQPRSPQVVIPSAGTVNVTARRALVETDAVTVSFRTYAVEDPTKSCSISASASPLTCSISGLDPATSYTFSTVGVNAAGDSVASNPSTAVVPGPPATPGKPTVVVTDVGDVAVTVPPGSGGGVPVDYTVTSVEDPTKTCTVLASASPLTCAITGLDPETSYTFTAIGGNTLGDSSASPASDAVFPNLPPAVPGKPTVVLTAPGAVDVTVTAGGGAGGEVADFTVTSVQDPTKTCTVLATASPLACSITGLDPTQSYTFTATAGNDVGDSAASVPSDAVTAAVPPTPQAPTTEVSGSGAVDVTIIPGAGPGGAVVEYTVTSVQDPTKTCTVAATANPLECSISGLDPSEEYTFTVTAGNGAGDSAASPASTGTVAGQPATPGQPTVAITDVGEVDVTVVPGAGGGTPVEYTLTSVEDPTKTCTVAATANPLTCSITGLDPDTSYTFTVVAGNGVGDSSASQPSDAVYPNLPPPTPGQPTAEVTGSGAVDVTVVPGTGPGGDAADYTITAVEDPTKTCTVAATASPLTCEITGLDPTQSYTFTVIGGNDVGDSQASTPSNAVTPSVPPTPAAPTAEVTGSGAVDIAIVPGTGPGGAALDYTVSSVEDPTKTCTVAATASPLECSISGLNPADTYTFMVVASNGAGDSAAGPASNGVVAGPPATPSQPTVVLDVPGTVVVTVVPGSGGGVPTDYTVTSVEDPTKTCTVAASTVPLACSMAGLDPNTEYTFTVTSGNGAGDSLASPPSDSIVPNVVPNVPQQPVVAVTASGSVDVTVVPGTGTGGSAVDYTVTSVQDPTKTCTVAASANPLTCAVTGLDPLIAYTFTVVAGNGAGDSAPSPASAPIIPGQPAVPSAPTVVVDGDGAVTIQINPGTGGGSPTQYTVNVSPGGATCTVLASANPLSCSLTGLDPTQQYSFTVNAENVAGSTADSAAAIATPGSPGTPGQPTATPMGPGEIKVLVVPATTGGTANEFRVTASPGGATCTVLATVSPLECWFTGLDPNTAYTFTAQALNGAATSAESPPSNSVKTNTGVAKPAKPRNAKVKGKPTGNKFLVRWKRAPSASMNRPVAYYQLTVQQRGRKAFIINKRIESNILQYKITRAELKRGMKMNRGDIAGAIMFTVKIRAINPSGRGPAAVTRFLMVR